MEQKGSTEPKRCAQAYSGVYTAEQELSAVQNTYDSHQKAAEDARSGIERTRDTAAALQQEQSQIQQVLLLVQANQV